MGQSAGTRGFRRGQWHNAEQGVGAPSAPPDEEEQGVQQYQDMAANLAQLIARRAKRPEAALAVQMRRLGRRAPRRVRRDLQAVVSAAELARHPKLAMRIDATQVQAAHDRAVLWLREVDWTAQRAQARRATLAGLAFNLLLACGGTIALLAWSGIIGPQASEVAGEAEPRP